MGKIARHMELEDCVAQMIPLDAVVGLGGLHFHNMPMALVREMIRQKVGIRRLVPSIDGSIDADQLIGAGLVQEVQVAYLGMEIYGLAPRFRAAAESGELRVRDCEEAGFALAVVAGATGQPFATLPAGFMPTTQATPTVPSVNPDDYQVVDDPFTGTQHTAVRAIAPDVALIHVQAVDFRGNCGFFGGAFLDVEMAKASTVCIVQAEAVYEELPPECRSFLPGYVVDAYCVVPGGAHPGSSHGVYNYDDEHLRRYVEMAKTGAGFAAYGEDVIGATEDDYRAAERLLDRLEELRAEPVG